MHTIVAISEIKQRAEAIGQTLSSIAHKAEINPSTVLRLQKAEAEGRGYGGRAKTREMLLGALEAEEARVRGHLQKIEPRQEAQIA